MKPGIYLIRHGQSQGNIGDSSRYDVALTDKGIQQASELHLNVDLAICSPLRRAQETLHYSNITYNTLEIYDPCRERICQKGDCLIFEHFERPETDDEFNERIRQISIDLLNYIQHYTSIAMICHGCVIRSLTGHKLKNTQIVMADIELLDFIANGGKLHAPCCNEGSW